MKRSGRQDEMVGWHHRLSGHEFEQAPGNGERQGNGDGTAGAGGGYIIRLPGDPEADRQI